MKLDVVKYKMLEADMTGFFRVPVIYHDIDIRVFYEWSDEYIAKMHAGPAEFWPWYQEQRIKDLRWDVPYPHDVFPALMTDGYKDFYEVFEF